MAPPTPLDLYFREAKAAGCPLDQVENFLRAGLVMQPKQLVASAAARACDSRCPACEAGWKAGLDPKTDCVDCGPTQILYGGARGGGKTHWGIAQVFCDDCARFPGLKFLYLRLAKSSAEEAVNDLRKSVLRHTPHTFQVKDSLLTRKDNGSTIKIRHFQNEKDIGSFVGLEYDGMFAEEANLLSGTKLEAAQGSLRTSKPGWRPRAYFTANPGGVGHSYLKRRFVLPQRARAETFTRFIPATVRDNRFVDPEYRATLNRYTGLLRARWLDGDWDAQAGQFFEAWSDSIHVRAPEHISTSWDFWIGLDYGFNHPTMAYLFARDHDGTTWVLDEHHGRKMQVADHAEAIRGMCRRHGTDIDALDAIVAGGDVFNRDRDGKSTADAYETHGIRLERANNDRTSGAAEITKMLGDEKQPPRVFISPRCKRLIEAIPEMLHDDLDSEKYAKVDIDEDGNGGDDAVDAFRYGLMFRPGKRGSAARDPFADRQWN